MDIIKTTGITPITNEYYSLSIHDLDKIDTSKQLNSAELDYYILKIESEFFSRLAFLFKDSDSYSFELDGSVFFCTVKTIDNKRVATVKLADRIQLLNDTNPDGWVGIEKKNNCLFKYFCTLDLIKYLNEEERKSIYKKIEYEAYKLAAEDELISCSSRMYSFNELKKYDMMINIVMYRYKKSTEFDIKLGRGLTIDAEF